MKKGRLEAFSDGVVAIIITIMVLELHIPHSHEIADLLPLLPAFLSYVLSFIYVGIYWNNHHHMIYTMDSINGGVLWANLNLLFWLSLVPFVTEWMGESHFAKWPLVVYGLVLIMNSLSFNLLASLLIRHAGKDCSLAQAYGKNWKGKISTLIYLLAIGLAFIQPWLSFGLYWLVAVIWFIPDPRLEKKIVSEAVGSGGE